MAFLSDQKSESYHEQEDGEPYQSLASNR